LNSYLVTKYAVFWKFDDASGVEFNGYARDGPTGYFGYVMGGRMIKVAFGLIVCIVGFAMNAAADQYLISLKSAKNKTYKMPRGGFFEYVVCANYFGEIIQHCGFMLAFPSPATIAVLFVSVCNLMPRAAKTYEFYEKNFGSQAVADKKRIFPFVY